MARETKTPPQPIYRIGRQPDAWRPPDWSRASADGTFGNRFDDPESYYRVLYASSHEVSCSIETPALTRGPSSLRYILDPKDVFAEHFSSASLPSRCLSADF